MQSIFDIGKNSNRYLTELFFLAAAFYVVSIITSITLVFNRSDTDEENTKRNIYIIACIPLVFFLLFILTKKSRPESISNKTIYIVPTIIFILVSIGINNMANTTIDKETKNNSDEEKKSYFYILLWFFICYVLLRAILFSDKEISTGLPLIMYSTLTVFFSFIGTLPIYVKLLLDTST
jgi:Ca2+/Na+ antiporter